MPDLKAELSQPAYQRLITQKRVDGFEDKSVGEWLDWKFMDVELEPGLQQSIHRATKSELAPMWMKNLAENMPSIRRSTLTLRNLLAEEPVDKPCVVIGRGPSVFKKKHLELIAEHRDQLTVVACDGILKDCLNHNIIPDYVTVVDGSPVVMKWFDGLIRGDLRLDKTPISYEEKTTPFGTTKSSIYRRSRLILSTQSNPDVAKYCRYLFGDENVYWFQPATDHFDAAHSVTRNLCLMTCWDENPNGVVSMDCGGNVGVMSWIFAWTILKHKKVCLVGMDCGYPEGMPYNETYYWETAISKIPAIYAGMYYESYYNPFHDETYILDPVFKTYQLGFFDMVVKTPDWLSLSNASSGTLVYDPWIKQVHLEDWLKEVSA